MMIIEIKSVVRPHNGYQHVAYAKVGVPTNLLKNIFGFVRTRTEAAACLPSVSR